MINQQETSKPIFSRQDLIRLILPLVAEQILTVTIGFADTFMVSGVGEAAVSSVSLVDSLNMLFIQVLGAMATGGAVVCGQYLGAGDKQQAKKCAAQLISVMIISTMLLMTIMLVASRFVLRGVFGQIEEDVMGFAQIYLLITAVSYPFIGLYNAGAALFRAQGNSKVSLNASMVMNLINVGGNALFIYVFKMGVLGAALATLAGRMFAAIWLLYRNQHANNLYRIESFSDLYPRKKYISSILYIGIPSGFENGMFQIGKLCVTSLTSTLGTAAIAAHAVANTITSMANVPGNAMNLAMVPVVSRCLGAGDKKQAKKYAKQLLMVAIAGLAVTNAVLYFIIPGVTIAFHLSPEARVLCISVVRLFDLFSIFFWAFSFTMPNVLRSGGDARYTMVVSACSMWIFRVVLSYFFVRQMNMGLVGVWLGMFIDWICRGIFFNLRFFSGKWMEHKLI